MSARDKWVRRFSVDETSRHKNGFTIYKITSVLFPLDSPEAVTVVSVWKRYSDVQLLHKSMRVLHAGLHLRGTFPALPRYSYFKRFQQDVIEERAKITKTLLEFIAEHKLLFTSTDFVNFLQTGYPEPEPTAGGVINAIRSSLHLPIEESPPLEYQTSDDDCRSPTHSARIPPSSSVNQGIDETDFISQIPIYEAADVELRPSSKQSPISHRLSKSDSFDSINSLDSINSDFCSELDKITIEKSKPCVKKNVLPDLINFDAPSTSKFDDYHTMPRRVSETTSLVSTFSESVDDRSSRVSVSCQSAVSLSNIECKTKTEDSYVFEAGYMLNLAAKYEDTGEYRKAFDCYKSGIEKMLIGVQSDSDPQRRALIKEKTNKYLSYAESIYKNHLCDAEQSLLPDVEPSRQCPEPRLCPVPLSMLRRPYAELAQYRVLAVLGTGVMLVLHQGDQKCYAMKVIQKVPKNLTEFDEYFLQNVNETREPVLPTIVPYMVPLHSYIQTNNLIFLILSYAPGEKLFDYIKNYTKSVPTTPAREVNLENVFTEPKNKTIEVENIFTEVKHKIIDVENVSEPKIRNSDVENDNFDCVLEIKDLNIEFNVNKKVKDSKRINDENISIIDRIEANIQNNNKNMVVNMDNIENIDMSVNDIVKNSQRLLQNVDKVLNEDSKINIECKVKVECKQDNVEEVKCVVNDVESAVERRAETPLCDNRPTSTPCGPPSRPVLPPAAVSRWAAELLTAIESLHNAGVICRDLDPSNILLGERGQIILTYFVCQPGPDVWLARLRARAPSAYVAPELYRRTYGPDRPDHALERVCDFWSFGAILYELLCGVSLSAQAGPALNVSRECWATPPLPVPTAAPLDARSLLTQLLTYEPSERLGARGIEEIKLHPYFKHIDWRDVYDTWIVPG